MKLIFCLQINFKNSFKLIISFQTGVARYAQISRNNKFSNSLQFLKKEVSDEVNFLHADKHERYRKAAQAFFKDFKKDFEDNG